MRFYVSSAVPKHLDILPEIEPAPYEHDPIQLDRVNHIRKVTVPAGTNTYHYFITFFFDNSDVSWDYYTEEERDAEFDKLINF